MNEAPAVELDYAFAAQWARVNADGTLTAIDASFLKAAVPKGTPMAFAIAARVRFVGGLTACDIRIDMRTPTGTTISYTGSVDASEAPVYGDDRRHMLLALNSSLLVEEYGQVKIDVFLDERQVRTLMFELVDPAGTDRSRAGDDAPL